MKSAFSRNLVKIRHFHELTQQQAADKIGVNRASLASYEEGRAEPSFQVLMKICKGYQVENIESLLWNEKFLERSSPAKHTTDHPVVKAYSKAQGKEKQIVDFILGL